MKNREKKSKIMTFQKKLTSVTFDFSAFLHVPNSPRLMTLYASKKNNDEKLPFLGIFFEKVIIAPPQPRKNSLKEKFNAKMPERKKLSLAKSRPHAKN